MQTHRFLIFYLCNACCHTGFKYLLLKSKRVQYFDCNATSIIYSQSKEDQSSVVYTLFHQISKRTASFLRRNTYCSTDVTRITRNAIQHNFIFFNNTIYNITLTLLPSVNTLIVRGTFCGVKYTHHTFTPIIKHLVTATANKHPGKKSVTDNMRKSHWHQAVHIT